MSNDTRTLQILSERCKSCGMCISVCPSKTLSVGKNLNAQGYAFVVQSAPEKCINCNICRIVCPDVAIGVVNC